MRHARAHYVHVVCTSGHPLWRCSKQPIIYSTLISTHVNPHQSSHSQGYRCGSHTASWQDTGRKYKKQLLGLIWTCRHATAGPPSPDCNQLSPSQPIIELQEKKVIGQTCRPAKMLWFFTGFGSTPEATRVSDSLQRNSCRGQKSGVASEHAAQHGALGTFKKHCPPRYFRPCDVARKLSARCQHPFSSSQAQVPLR